MDMGTDGGVPVMRLPAWATPGVKFPQCECELALPTVARVKAAYRPFLPSGGRNGSTHRFYDMTFTYDLCRVCVVYEREVRGEISYRQAERWAARLIAMHMVGKVEPAAIAPEPPRRYTRKTCDTCGNKRKWMTAGESTCYGCRRKRAKERAA
jgi:hypothetical protein